jgi:hypothetical protein
MQIFFIALNGRAVVKWLSDTFTLEDFINAASEAIGTSREETMRLRFAVHGKPLFLDRPEVFNRYKEYITNECNIFHMPRLHCSLCDP